MIQNVPSIYNGESIYNQGGGGGGGGGETPPQYQQGIVLLLNGVVDTEQPSSGSLVKVDSYDLPINNIKAFASQGATGPIIWDSANVLSALNDLDTGWTLDWWFKPISHDQQVTPFFFGNKYPYVLSCDYYENIAANAGYSIDYFARPYSSYRFTIDGGQWHHLAVETKKKDASKCESWCFRDGKKIRHETDRVIMDWTDFPPTMNISTHTVYQVAQICLRTGIVWEDEFTPPTRAYSLY